MHDSNAIKLLLNVYIHVHAIRFARESSRCWQIGDCGRYCTRFQADVTTGDRDETIKSILNRLDDVENENIVLKQLCRRLMQESTNLNERLTQENADLNQRLTQENDDLNQRLTQENADLNDRLTQKIDALERENNRLNDEVQYLKDHQAKLASSVGQKATSLDPEPDTRSQYMAFACTNDMVTLSCPSGRTILAVSANYGQYSSEVTECTDCCAPNPEYDCTELVEENRPSDWLAIQALCNNQTSCEFENAGTVIDECEEGYASDYMQLFYDCLPDDETGPVAFTAWANTGTETPYSVGDIIVFNKVLSNAGGHYSRATSSFICPWHALYLVSVNVQGYTSRYMSIYLVRNDVHIGLIIIDDISGVMNRGSTTVVTECDRGDILWVRTGYGGALRTGSIPITLFTAHMIHRY